MTVIEFCRINAKVSPIPASKRQLTEKKRLKEDRKSKPKSHKDKDVAASALLDYPPTLDTPPTAPPLFRPPFPSRHRPSLLQPVPPPQFVPPLRRHPLGIALGHPLSSAEASEEVGLIRINCDDG